MTEDRIIHPTLGSTPEHRAGEAIDAGEAAQLPPLELTLAANAAMERAHRATERQWRATKGHLAGQPALADIGNADAPNRLEQAIANLRAAGLWPWRWLSTQEAGRRLGVNDSRVRQLIIAGKLRARAAASGVGYVVDDEEIDRYRATRKERPDAP